MVKIIYKLLSIMALLAVSQTVLALTSLTASIDANPVMSNESILLTVIADDSVDRDELDSSQLLNDFIIARTEVSSQTSIINFKTSKTTRWQIVLIPRKTGRLNIPELSVNGIKSQSISLQVIESQNNTSANKQKDVFITNELSATDIYVQQLVTLTIKLHIGVQMQRGSLSDPILSGATINQIGKDIESDEIINGKRYRIIERTYAVTPEQSGEIVLETPMFSGDIMVQSKRRSGFLNFGETKPVNILGEKLALTVRPIPDNFPDNNSWLPSELLTLHQEWQPEPSEFKVGEPITRTLTLTAAGLSESQLPIIKMEAPTGMKIYPDQAELHSSLTKERLISQKRQNFALVASRAGEYTLPKITISWWNTVTNKFQEAILPEQIITVHANPDALLLPSANTESNAIEQPIGQLTNDDAQPIIIEKTGYLQWVFLTLWLITVITWLLHVRYIKRNSNSKNTPNTGIKQKKDNYLLLMAACKQNNAEHTLSLILPWLNNLHSNSIKRNISTLSEALTIVNNQEFSAALEEVQQYLYGKSETEQPWNGEKMLKVIQHINSLKNLNNNEKKFNLNPI